MSRERKNQENASKGRVYRKSLNANQVHILLMVYKFRFVSVSLLSSYKKKSLTSIVRSLALLEERGYLEKQYHSSYRIQGKPAAYYLSKQGMAFLRDHPQVNESTLHAYYKNKTVSRDFIDHHLKVMSVLVALRDLHPEQFHIFTKADQANTNYFSELKPDLFLLSQTHLEDIAYWLEISGDMPMYLIRKKLKELIAAHEDGDLTIPSETALLFVLQDVRIETAFSRHAAKLLEEQGIDDLIILTTTYKALTVGDEAKIWSNVTEPQELVALK